MQSSTWMLLSNQIGVQLKNRIHMKTDTHEYKSSEISYTMHCPRCGHQVSCLHFIKINPKVLVVHESFQCSGIFQNRSAVVPYEHSQEDWTCSVKGGRSRANVSGRERERETKTRGWGPLWYKAIHFSNHTSIMNMSINISLNIYINMNIWLTLLIMYKSRWRHFQQ